MELSRVQEAQLLSRLFGWIFPLSGLGGGGGGSNQGGRVQVSGDGVLSLLLMAPLMFGRQVGSKVTGARPIFSGYGL